MKRHRADYAEKPALVDAGYLQGPLSSQMASQPFFASFKCQSTAWGPRGPIWRRDWTYELHGGIDKWYKSQEMRRTADGWRAPGQHPEAQLLFWGFNPYSGTYLQLHTEAAAPDAASAPLSPANKSKCFGIQCEKYKKISN